MDWTEQSNLADEAKELLDMYYGTKKLTFALHKYFGDFFDETMTIDEIFINVIIRLSEDSDAANCSLKN